MLALSPETAGDGSHSRSGGGCVFTALTHGSGGGGGVVRSPLPVSSQNPVDVAVVTPAPREGCRPRPVLVGSRRSRPALPRGGAARLRGTETSRSQNNPRDSKTSTRLPTSCFYFLPSERYREIHSAVAIISFETNTQRRKDKFQLFFLKRWGESDNHVPLRGGVFGGQSSPLLRVSLFQQVQGRRS